MECCNKLFSKIANLFQNCSSRGPLKIKIKLFWEKNIKFRHYTFHWRSRIKINVKSVYKVRGLLWYNNIVFKCFLQFNLQLSQIIFLNHPNSLWYFFLWIFFFGGGLRGGWLWFVLAFLRMFWDDIPCAINLEFGADIPWVRSRYKVYIDGPYITDLGHD